VSFGPASAECGRGPWRVRFRVPRVADWCAARRAATKARPDRVAPDLIAEQARLAGTIDALERDRPTPQRRAEDPFVASRWRCSMRLARRDVKGRGSERTIGPPTGSRRCASAAICVHDSNGRFSRLRRSGLVTTLAGLDAIFQASRADQPVAGPACVRNAGLPAASAATGRSFSRRSTPRISSSILASSALRWTTSSRYAALADGAPPTQCRSASQPVRARRARSRRESACGYSRGRRVCRSSRPRRCRGRRRRHRPRASAP
jgi:hypothetical protein